MNPVLLGVCVALAGGLGAVLRVLVDGWAAELTGGRHPWGTVIVNVTGSLVLGVLVGASPGGDAAAILGTGLLGGYTTFSTASVDAVRLADGDGAGPAAAYAVGMALACVGAAACGWALVG